MGEPWPRFGVRALGSAAAPHADLRVPAANEVGRPAADPAAAALRLYAEVLGAADLDAAAHRLVAALAAELGLASASVGVFEDGRTRLLASTLPGLDHPQAELPQRIAGAMDEAIEQGVSLAWPAEALPAGRIATHIRVEQEALQRLLGAAVATVPLGFQGEVFGALCVARPAGTSVGADFLLQLEQLAVLAVPALHWMRDAARPWHWRTRRVLVRIVSELRQPERRTARRTLVGATLGLVLLAVVPLDHDVGGRARVEGAEQRVLSAPADGFVKTSHVRPGDRVRAGDALVDLLDGDLRLERERWTSQLAQHENAYAAAMGKSDRTAAATSLARIGEAQSQLALVDDQLQRGRVVAPFDGLVIQGDLSQSIGAPVRQGDTLLTLAGGTHFRVVVEVDEIDIARVHPGQAGRLSLSSLPWDREDLVVERIAPLAKAAEGRNVFEVEARLVAPGPDLRPGLLGRAELTTGRMPPLWAWTGHTLNRLRVAWWAWLG